MYSIRGGSGGSSTPPIHTNQLTNQPTNKNQDPKAFPCPDDGEVHSLWYMADGEQRPAKLHGCVKTIYLLWGDGPACLIGGCWGPTRPTPIDHCQTTDSNAYTPNTYIHTYM